MQWFEKIYKERFSSENIVDSDPNLDGVDSSELWAQISKSIPQEESTNKAFPWWRALGVLLILGFFTAGLFFFNNNQSIHQGLSENKTFENKTLVNNDVTLKNNQNPKTKNASTSIITQDLLAKELNPNELEKKVSKSQSSNTQNHNLKTTDKSFKSNETQSSPISNIEPSTNVSKSQNKAKIASSLTKASPKKQKKVALKNLSQPNQSEKLYTRNSNENENNISSESESSVNDIIDSLISTPEDPLSSISSNPENNSLEKKNRSATSPIATPLDSRIEINILKLDQVWPPNPERAVEQPVMFPFTPPTDINKTPNPWSIKFGARINIFAQQYRDDTNPEMFASEANQSIDSLRYGSGFGMLLGYKLNSNWSISAGLESNEYKNRLSKITTTNTIVFDSVYQKNRNAKIIRTVGFTNKISTITIPLNINYDYNLTRKFGLGASIGLAYSLVTSQKVKLLARENKFLEITSPNKQFENYFSLRFNPYIKYRLLDDFELSMDIGFSIQDHGYSSFVDLNHRSFITTVGLGLKYNFK